MTIIPANETAYRRKVRHRLTLDLYTRDGEYWTFIDAMREQWRVNPIVAVPAEPNFHAEVVGLMDRNQMPERFHMPDASHAEWNSVAWYLKSIQHIWKELIALPGEREGDWRSGANVAGWMTWTPFISACVLYDPPPDKLLEFAEHDDHNAAALKQCTFSQDGDVRERSGVHKASILAGDFHKLEDYGDALRDSFYESTAPVPRGKRGAPPASPLQDVQCAIWRESGISSAEIGRRITRGVRDNADTYEPGHASYRQRSDAAEDAVKRGRQILEERKRK